jgi:2-oxoglutarate ferredoxin oxidoreductase subunit beta
MPIKLDSTGPTMKDFYTQNTCTWCNGCGNYGIWTAIKTALTELKIDPSQCLLCFDVGCHGNGSDKIKAYTFHGLHGRVLPFAAGAKLANPKIPVVAFGGDGARPYFQGCPHWTASLRSTARRNPWQARRLECCRSRKSFFETC